MLFHQPWDSLWWVDGHVVPAGYSVAFLHEEVLIGAGPEKMDGSWTCRDGNGFRGYLCCIESSVQGLQWPATSLFFFLVTCRTQTAIHGYEGGVSQASADNSPPPPFIPSHAPFRVLLLCP